MEDQLIVHCARVRVEPARADAIRALLQDSLDWQYLIRVLNRNQIASLFYHGLTSVPNLTLDEEVRQNLRNHYWRNTHHNLLLKAEFLRVLDLFSGAGIICLPLKGLMLAESVYGNLAIREYGDLDILVSDTDYPEAERLLFTLGYDFNPYVDTEPTPRFQSGHHSSLLNPQNGIYLELHWELIERYRGIMQMKDVPPEQITTTDFEDRRVTVFEPEFLLLYLCVHGYKHQWERLFWLCDVAEVIHAHPDLDWQTVLQLANEYHLEKILALGLYLVEDILECEVPASVRAKLFPDRIIEELGASIKQQVFSTTSALGLAHRQTIDYSVFNYMLLTERSQRLRYLFRAATGKVRFTPNKRDRDWVHLPRGLSFLYFVIRPIRLLSQYGINYLRMIYRMLTS